MLSNYNAIDYINDLEKVGFTPEQAKVQAQALGKALDEKAATKKDLEILELNLRKDIEQVRTDLEITKKDLELKIEQVRTDLELKIEQVHSTTLKWVVGLMIGQTGVILAALKFMLS